MPTSAAPGPSTRIRRLVAALGVALALLAAAGLWAAFQRAGPAPAGAPDAASDAGSGASPGGVDAHGAVPEGLERILGEVLALRGLALDGDLEARVLSHDRLVDKLLEQTFEEYGPERLAADARLLATLRLVEPGTDLRAIIERLYREQVLGLYVPADDSMYVSGETAALTPHQQVTVAHEVVHALQDRRWDLEDWLDLDEREADALLARLALVEGDAVLTQQLWAAGHQSERERAEAERESRQLGASELGAAPRYLREALVFPYREGQRFVSALFDHGGYAAVDAAFDDPPVTTQQVLHPQRYLAGQAEPVPLAISATPGGDWQETVTYTFGEFDVAEWLHPVGPRAVPAATGWAGGLTKHWARGDDDAVALALAFRDPADAGAACAATPLWYEAVAGGRAEGEGLRRGDRDWMSWSCSEAEVRVGFGPDAATATSLAAP